MITQALVTNGAKVYIIGRREEALKRVVEQYNSGPGEVIALPGDISSKDDVKHLADEIAENNNNIRFSNAGKPDFNSAQTNLTAQSFTTAAFLPLLAKGRDVTPGYTSSVVNVTSISGVMKGSSGRQFAYTTSKACMLPLPKKRCPPSVLTVP
ncbi:hypothetical protein MMC28_000168 [Mycoblastus sanguinarius]|nr:hypothetical protein [Mycoblastus sanguinarius]